LIQVIDVHASAAGADSTGQILDGEISIRGYLRTSALELTHKHGNCYKVKTPRHSDGKTHHISTLIFLDKMPYASGILLASLTVTGYLIPTAAWTVLERDKYRGSVLMQLTGASENQFKRIGYMEEWYSSRKDFSDLFQLDGEHELTTISII
jgi:hypothetical protein